MGINVPNKAMIDGGGNDVYDAIESGNESSSIRCKQFQFCIDFLEDVTKIVKRFSLFKIW